MAVRETPWAGADVSGESHHTIYNWVHTGHDLPGLSDVHLRYSAQGAEIQEAAGALGAALQGLAPFWHGRDAQAATESVTQFVSAMRELGTAVSEQAHTMGKVHAATVQVQQEVTEPVEPSALDALGGRGPGQPGGVPAMATEAITGGVEDLHAQQQAAAAAQEKARAAYRTFLAQTGDAAASAPPLPALPQAAVGATVAAAVIGHIAGIGPGGPGPAGSMSPARRGQPPVPGAASGRPVVRWLLGPLQAGRQAIPRPQRTKRAPGMTRITSSVSRPPPGASALGSASVPVRWPAVRPAGALAIPPSAGRRRVPEAV